MESASPPKEHRQRDHESGDGAGDADIEQRRARTNGRLDADQRAEGADERRGGYEVGKRGVNAVPPGDDEMSELVREQDAEQRQREWQPHQQARGILPDPAQGKQRQRVIVGGEGGQAVDEVELQPRTHDQSGEERQQQQQDVQPVGSAARGRGNKDLWIGRDFEGIGDGPRGIRHR